MGITIAVHESRSACCVNRGGNGTGSVHRVMPKSLPIIELLLP
jgi:hypothetical protein